MRQVFVLIHRYVGLTLTLFLMLAGVTGSFIAFYDELETQLHPEFRRVQLPAQQAAISAVTLATMLQTQYPDAMFNRINLQHAADEPVSFYLQPRPGNKHGLANDEIFVNPYTGQVLAQRKWGDITQGSINLLPFLYRLHYSLALDKTGRLILGVLALLWTVDCFIGAYLTWPARQRKAGLIKPALTAQAQPNTWLRRWWRAWQVRWQGGAAKVNFDLHRAGGLWLWAMLLVFAWSSVAFNLRDVYYPVMGTLFSKQGFGEEIPRLAQPLLHPRLDAHAALATGRSLMQQLSLAMQFAIHHEAKLYYDAGKGTYTYIVNSSRDVSEKSANTAVMFNANSGERLAVYLPTGAAAGDSITQWLLALHTAKVWGLPMQIFVSAMGVGVFGLSVTGVLIWLKKRQARQRVRQLKHAQL
ncbi:PepSY-associated TM helix domain-containing protein [Methylophilus luteus]|uniref:PepSY-associated TM helix domain-containing protein n=1 Tax=Methylophilus luteus TaxID=640108 RepID=A0ABW3F0X5_9PROT